MDHLGSGNVVCIGMTRWGKSYMIKEVLRRSKKGVIYFNTKHESDDLHGYFYADKKTSMTVIINALKKGKKINYVPSDDSKIRDVELFVLINKLLGSFTEKAYCYLAIDEVHMFRDQQIRTKIIDLCTIGISKGVRLCAISQRMAYMNRAIVTQSETKLIFHTEMDDSYYKSYSMPADQIKQMIGGRKYHFVSYNCGVLSGAFKI